MEGDLSDASSAPSDDPHRAADKITRKAVKARLDCTKGYCPQCRTYFKKANKGEIDILSQEILDHVAHTHKNPVTIKTGKTVKVFPALKLPPYDQQILPIDLMTRQELQDRSAAFQIAEAKARKKKLSPQTTAEKPTKLQKTGSSAPPKSTGAIPKIQAVQGGSGIVPPRPTNTPTPLTDIKLSNRYDPLSDLETETEDEGTPNPILTKPRKSPIQQQIKEKAQAATRKQPKQIKPPPIVLQGKMASREAHTSLTQHLDTMIKKEYHLKFTKNNIIINCSDPIDYDNCTRILQQDTNSYWHTYATQDRRTHAFVVKGLDNDPDPEDVKTELQQEHGIKVKSVHVMKTKYRQLYLVITTIDHKLQQLQKIKYIYRTSVTWERRKQMTDIIQCKRCCQWGHATSNCYRQPKCNNCAQNHLTKDCEKTDDDYKCANCGGDHKSQDTSCSVYKYKHEKLTTNKRPPTQKQTYIPAPLPTRNAWAPLPGTKNLPVWQTHSQSVVDSPVWQTHSQSAVEPEPMDIATTHNQPSRVPTGSYAGEPLNQISGLVQAMQELNNAVNLAELLRFIKDFTASVRDKPASERGLAAFQFITNIGSYNI